MFGKKHDELDQVISGIRAEDVPSSALEQSTQRVWQQIEAGSMAIPASEARGCAGVRADVPLLQKAELSPARRLIVEDHLRECASCRAYAAGGADPAATAAHWQLEPLRQTSRWTLGRYGWAAAAVVLIAAAGAFIGLRYVAGPSGSRAQVESITGHAYLVSATSENALKAGDQVAQGQLIRTSADSHAILRLFDGSRVEMNQRTQFSVSAGFRNTTIHLEQGDIIVQAPHRKSGHLYVLTPDCTVSDTGTIFSIESGTKGSRVGVVEGTVSVAHDGKNSVLQAGQSVATAQSVGAVPVSGQIAWSQNRQQYAALLDEFSRLGHRLEQIPSPAPRYQSTILPRVPEDTVLYVSVPNLGNTFAQGEQIFQDELNRSPVLQQWWGQVTKPQQDVMLGLAIGEIEKASQYLGDEMVLVGDLQDKTGPVLLAPIKNQGLADFLRQQISMFGKSSKPSVQIVDESSIASVSSSGKELVALVRPDVLVVGSAAGVVRMNAALASGNSGFENTDFGKQIRGVYSRGAQVLFAADLERIVTHVQQARARRGIGTPESDNGALTALGFTGMKYLIATHGDISGQTENRAVVGFAQQRSGLASWLAAPAPMGSLNFISANATAVASAVTKQPANMFDDLMRLVQARNHSDVSAELEQEEANIGVDFRNNLAGALGGEVTFAVDGPVLPKPSWKLIAEVNEPSVLQQSIAKLVQLAGQHFIVSGKPVVTLEQQQAGGRTFYTIAFAQGKGPSEIDYTYANGYLVAGPSRAVVMNALATYTNGDSLATSGAFHSLLPRDSYANFSALMYWNVGPLVQPLAGQLGQAGQGTLQQLAENTKPAAICAYGGTNTIEVASTTNLLDFQPDAMTLLNLLGQARGTSRIAKP
ncbi:MAG TPA: FecR domain-containing protein [Candidatus Acidoferrales bacterium]|nr:FecR domain-containing protein [Candidatus Acidoferrales bacterium]